MANYYVSTTGSNGNAGTTPQAPWGTIAYAVTQVSAGDTIYLMPGTFTETDITPAVSGSSGNRITITSYDRNNRAHVRGTTANATFVFKNCSYWTLSYVVMGGTSANDIASMGGVIVGGYGSSHSANTSYITVDNCEIKWTSTKHPILINSGSASYGPRYTRITNNYIHNTTGDPTKYNETITQAGNVSYTLIEGNRLIDVAFIGIDAIGYDSTSADYPNLQPDHFVVRNNYVNYVRTASASPGIGIKNDGGGTHILIENNTVLLAPGCVSGAEPFHDDSLTNMKYIIVRNNVFDATNSGYGISWGMGTNGMYADSLNPDSRNTYVAKVTNSVAVHNVIRASTFGLLLFRAESTAIKNNVVVNTGAHGLTQSETLTADAALTTTGNVVNGNLYYSSNGGQVFKWYGGALYTTFAAWKSGTSQDANSYYAEPIFSDTANLDYTLTASSPGNGAAIALTTTTNSGSASTSMTVADASYFCDGYGLIGGDVINVGGTEMTIQSVNYTTNTLTLAEAATWSSGASVHYAYDGTAPSIGLTNTVSTGTPITPPDPDEEGPVTPPATGTTKYTAQVSSAANNCYRRNSDSGFDTTDLLFAGDYTTGAYDYTAGMRFALPADVAERRTASAYLKLNATFVQGGPWPLRIYGEQSSNSSAFSDATDFDARTKTTAYVDWSPSVSAGGAYTSPDLSSIIEELAQDYGGLSSGDYVTFFVESQASGFGNVGLVGWTDYTTSSSGAPTLEINLTNAGADSGAITLQVAHSYDDVSGSNANYYPTSTTGFIGDNTAGDYDYTTGMRFVLSEAIPSTATITNAYLTVKSAGYVTAIPAMQIKGGDTANSARFTDKTNFDGRARTTASVNWTPGAWVSGTDYVSPDLSAIVQELVDDNGGLAMGAGIAMFLGTQAAGWGGSQALAYVYTYDNTPSYAAKLTIEWDLPSGGKGYGAGLTIGMRIGIGI